MDSSDQCAVVALSEADVMSAMRSMQSYVDITPGTFREIYQLAYNHAVQRLREAVPARKLMSVPVHCLQYDMLVVDAIGMLAAHGISGAPVLDADGVVCGVLSEKDVLRNMGVTGKATFMSILAACLRTPGCALASMKGVRVEAFMSTPPLTATEDTSAAQLMAVFREKSINRMPVCDAAGRPLGIVTRTDLLEAASRQGGGL
ncbi:CBS domain-containing protein [Megalodesulfovibrio paquesii]